MNETAEQLSGKHHSTKAHWYAARQLPDRTDRTLIHERNGRAVISRTVIGKALQYEGTLVCSKAATRQGREDRQDFDSRPDEGGVETLRGFAKSSSELGGIKRRKKHPVLAVGDGSAGSAARMLESSSISPVYA